MSVPSQTPSLPEHQFTGQTSVGPTIIRPKRKTSSRTSESYNTPDGLPYIPPGSRALADITDAFKVDENGMEQPVYNYEVGGQLISLPGSYCLDATILARSVESKPVLDPQTLQPTGEYSKRHVYEILGINGMKHRFPEYALHVYYHYYTPPEHITKSIHPVQGKELLHAIPTTGHADSSRFSESQNPHRPADGGHFRAATAADGELG